MSSVSGIPPEPEQASNPAWNCVGLCSRVADLFSRRACGTTSPSAGAAGSLLASAAGAAPAAAQFRSSRTLAEVIGGVCKQGSGTVDLRLWPLDSCP